MKARRRIVTSLDRSTKRRPTVRKIRSAIVPAPPRPAAAATTGTAAVAGPDAPPRAAPPPAGGDPAAESVELDLRVDLGRGLVLRNPVLVGSGGAGYGVEAVDALGLDILDALGALVTRGTTLRVLGGNPAPRMVERAGWLLSSVGLQNPGIEAVIERYSGTWAGWRTPVIVNLAADRSADFGELARRLDGIPGIAGLELNLSCPNTARGGLLFALDPTAAAAATAAARQACDLPILVKLSAGAQDPVAVARAVEDAGADAIVAVNTIPGMALRPDRTGSALGSAIGGLSGPPLRPIALRVVHEVARAVKIPVIAAGGVAALEDALDFLAAGASAVAVATAALADPGLPARLATALAAECRARGAATIDALVGTAQPRRAGPPASRTSEYRP